MAYLDKADLIRRLKVRLNRPTTDTAFTVSTTDDVLYDALTEAQDLMTKWIATFVPDVMSLAPVALSTADSGATYTFGTDADSANKFPLGFFSIFAARVDIPDNPLECEVDYLLEGTRIRILPVGTTRTFADSGPYAMFVAASNVISSSTEPTIPVICRLALLSKAAAIAAIPIGMDPMPYDAQHDEECAAVLASVRTQAEGKYRPPMSRRTRSSWSRYR